VEHEAFAGKMPAVKALSFAVNNLILVNAELSFAVYGWRHRDGSSRYNLCAQHRTERPS
jgi:hypothetical protein